MILKRQLERYRAAGMRLKCATEVEFYLYADDYRSAWERRYRDLNPLSYYRSDYHILQGSKDELFLRRVRDAMNAADIEVEFSKSEWGLGQQEVNLRYADALEMADRHALYKTGVKEMSARRGDGRELHGEAEDRRHRIVLSRPPERVGRGRRALARSRIRSGRPAATSFATLRRRPGHSTVRELA